MPSLDGESFLLSHWIVASVSLVLGSPQEGQPPVQVLCAALCIFSLAFLLMAF